MANDTNSFRTPIGRARGLGSAKVGAQHWLAYRIGAAALAVLTILFIILVISLIGAPYEEVVATFKQPCPVILTVLFLGFTFHHAAYGMQEVYEDYIHGKLAKVAAIALTKGLALVLFLAASFAVLKIAFGA
ncbi:succinate dehydrogenase, hydrophobic membrane anchor protein [Niveispirillum sp. KHB5.9]|uniref:succinate dehydrogenase, hydrophobic membrane anchor protein n=1 Tax=Niveispirillum sp. KHB5.9 TaxID=3400269 RepID=UPI003A8C4753